MHGRKEEITRAEYEALSDDSADTAGLAGWGMSDGVYHKNFPTDYNGFCAAADEVIVSARLENEEGNPKQEESDPDPSADLVFEVSDPALLSHLVAGVNWESAMYDFDHYRTVYVFADGDSPGVPDLSAVVAKLEPFQGEQEEGTPEYVGFSDDGKTLVVSSQMSEVVAYDTATWEERWRRPLNVMFLALSVYGDVVFMADAWGDDWFALDMLTGADAPDQTRPRGRTVSKTGAYAVDYGEDETLRFVDDDRVIEQAGTVEAVAFSADDKRMAVGGMFEHVTVMHPGGEDRSTIETGARASAVEFSPDARFLAACVDSYQLDIFAVAGGPSLTRMRETDFLTAVAWDPLNRFLAVTHIGGSMGYGGHISVHSVRRAP
jgi:hypothetical protein